MDARPDTVNHSVLIYEQLRERIAAAFELDEDDPVLIDTLDGETDLQDRIVAILREAKRTEAMMGGIKSLMDDLMARKQRFERKSEALRSAAAWAMQECGIKKIERPDMTISQRDGKPSLVITDDDPHNWPNEFCRIKRELNRAAIREACEQGAMADGRAYFGQSAPILTIRTR